MRVTTNVWPAASSSTPGVRAVASSSTSLYRAPGTNASSTTLLGHCRGLGEGEGLRRGCRALAFRELFLTRCHCSLATLDRRALELHGAELLTSAGKIVLGLDESRLPLGEVPEIAGELGLAGFQVGCAQTEHPLDGGARVS